jgi:long-chain acyl-CoA synthetase
MNYGMEICINDSLRYIMQNFKTFQPTGLVLVPLFVTTMYKKIWDEARKGGREKMLRFALKLSKASRAVGIDLRRVLFKDVLAAFGGRLCKIVCGGAPLDPEVAEKFEEFGIQISEGFGITECSPLVAVSPYYAPKKGSVGPAVIGCEVKLGEIVNAETDHGPEGELLVKGGNVMLGYYKNEEATAEAFTEDGWFRTGDIGYLDKDGYIYITGRKKNVIVLENGKNVFPEELEEHLNKLPGVAEAVVVGRKRDDGTIQLTALIYPAKDAFPKGTEQAAIEDALRQQVNGMNKGLVSYKQIRGVEFRDTEFEKNTSKKIRRNKIQ